jgi:hypothetical protein
MTATSDDLVMTRDERIALYGWYYVTCWEEFPGGMFDWSDIAMMNEVHKEHLAETGQRWTLTNDGETMVIG